MLTLASASPRRRELLGQLAVPCRVAPHPVDETPHPGEKPDAYVLRMAKAKLEAALVHEPGFVLAADTSVVVDEEILGKPVDDEEGRAMLSRLSGRTHRVLSGVAVGHQGQGIRKAEVVEASITFDVLSDAVIARYVATGEGRDKAGGYAVQGMAAAFVREIHGSYSAIVGLPLHETWKMLTCVGAIDGWPELPATDAR